MTYPLPKGLIAQHPVEPRDSARLLVLRRKPGTVPFGDSPPALSHHIFRDLPEFLRPGDCLVLNDTKVIPARLFGRKAGTGGKVELLLLERLLRRPFGPPRNDEKYAIYRCLGQPARSLRPGTRLVFKPEGDGAASAGRSRDHGDIQAEVVGWQEGERLVRFSATDLGGPAPPRFVADGGEGAEIEQVLRRIGEVPLPPYIGRPVEPRDAEWYQTVYARAPGAVAAPTAGLHFTESLLGMLREQGVRIAFVTLHVGWGTFKPVGEKELAGGRLHPERFRIPAETAELIARTKADGGRVVAVGTTVVRALETAYSVERIAYRGGFINARSRHFEADRPRNLAFKSEISRPGACPERKRGGSGFSRLRLETARDDICETGSRKTRSRKFFSKRYPLCAMRHLLSIRYPLNAIEGATDLFIRPGFEFRVADALVTNFHLPGTSLLLLVAAFAGEERVLAAYQEAIRRRYRFYSYGDAMIIV